MTVGPPPDEEVLAALGSLGPMAVQRCLRALSQLTPADDWNGNCLAAAFGAPGELRSAVEAHRDWDDDIGFLLWDTELLDIVADVTGLGDNAWLLHWMNMEEPERLAQLAAQYLATETGEVVAWRTALPPSPPVGDPGEVRAKAVAYLRGQLDAESMLRIFDDITRVGRREWEVANFMYGMSVRNALRAAGFSEQSLGVTSLDDHWVDLLWEAVVK